MLKQRVNANMALLLKLLSHLLILQFAKAQGIDCRINGEVVGRNGHQYSRFCMAFTCIQGSFVLMKDTITNQPGYKRMCKNCRLVDDPHITTFDGARYDWHGDCTYVLSQEEDGQGNVVSYVNNKFTKCYGAGASCIDTVYFQPRSIDTVIIITRGRQVIVNGFRQNIIAQSPAMQILKDANSNEYPVLAYWFDNCLHVISLDEENYLVKVCRGIVQVYAPTFRFAPDWKRSGMCGSPGSPGDPNTDLMLRDGTPIVNPGGFGFSNVVNSDFASDWRAIPTEQCDGFTGRRRRRSADEVDKEPCKASEAQKAEYIRICQNTVEPHPSLKEDTRKDFIDACAFDRCIIIQEGGDDETVQSWLTFWTEVVQHEVFEQEHQEDISDEELEELADLYDYYDYLDGLEPTQPPINDVTTTPALVLTCNISSVIEAGVKQFAFFTCPKTYIESRDFCKLYGWTLATPDEQFEQFNEKMPNDGEYWLDVQPETTNIATRPMTWYWQTSPKKNQTTLAQWKQYHYNVATPNHGTNCASLYQNDGLLAFKCETEWYFACESYHFFNVQRKEVKNHVHVQRRVSPQRNH